MATYRVYYSHHGGRLKTMYVQGWTFCQAEKRAENEIKQKYDQFTIISIALDSTVKSQKP